MHQEFETAIVGGGIVGSAIGYGLAKAGRSVIVLDGADHALRASRTNGGLVWVQGKGADFPAYHRMTRNSSDAWPQLAADLKQLTKIDIEYRRTGGFVFCVSEEQLDAHKATGEKMSREHTDYNFEICDRSRLERMLPGIRLGPKVCGAPYSPMDGDVNPLLMLRALLEAFVLSGGNLMTGQKVRTITPSEGGYRLATDELTIDAERVVIAAGNNATDFAESLDLPLKLVAERGQFLVTERVEQVFPYAAIGLRQHATGTFQLGTTNERVGLSLDVTSSGANYIANRVLSIMPDLAKLRVVRQWAGLRVLTPDGYPVIDRSRSHPGIHVVACHSGVTLAAFHAGPFAEWLSGGAQGNPYAEFSGSRFDTGVAA